MMKRAAPFQGEAKEFRDRFFCAESITEHHSPNSSAGVSQSAKERITSFNLFQVIKRF